MTRHTITVTQEIAAPALAVWAMAGAFCGCWHPWLEWVRPEAEGTVRHFKVKGEARSYRERLVHRDDASFTLQYQHVEGIQGVQAYEAQLQLIASGETCELQWRATVEAVEPRATEIADGTKNVFAAGAAHLASCFTMRNFQIASLAGELGATVMGHDASPLIMFLHGIGGNRGNWRKQLFALAATHLVVAIDLRGYGSSRLGVRQNTADDHCADILRVMDHFKVQRLVLVGLSFGAWIATSFAMRHAERLSGLVLAGGCTGMSEAPVVEREAFLAARQRPIDAGQTPADFAPQVVDVIAGPEAGDDVREELRRSMSAIPALTYRDAVYCFTHPAEVFDFSKIKCPVLLLTGEHDRLAKPTEIRGVATRMTAAGAAVQCSIIQHAGHVCNVEAPVAFNSALQKFLCHG